jgi:hypothetical protein
VSIESLSIVLHHSAATGLVRLVLIGIANHDGDGGAWPNISTLAKYANCSERTVQRAINELVELGEVAIARQAGGRMDTANNRRPNRYDILLTCPETCSGGKKHEVRTGVTLLSPQDSTGVDSGVTDRGSRGDSPVASGVTLQSHEPSLNHPENHPTSQPPPAEPSPAEVLALAVVGGLEKTNPELASVVGRPQLRQVCRPLVDLGWTPLMIEAWVLSPAQSWAGAGGGVVIHRLSQLGRPPERPRSVQPAPQNLCPEHPGQLMRAGSCDLCVRESTAGPPAEFVAARRGGAA